MTLAVARGIFDGKQRSRGRGSASLSRARRLRRTLATLRWTPARAPKTLATMLRTCAGSDASMVRRSVWEWRLLAQAQGMVLLHQDSRRPTTLRYCLSAPKTYTHCWTSLLPRTGFDTAG